MSIFGFDIPYGLKISKGQLPGVSAVKKFGENPDVDTATIPEDIWEVGGLYNYEDDGVDDIKYLSSSDNADLVDVSIEGLDKDGNYVKQILTLTGQTVVNLTTPLWRVFRMENLGIVNIAGTVYCHIDAAPTAGVPLTAKIRAIIAGSNNQTLMALYTVPKGKVCFVHRAEIGMSRSLAAGSAQTAYFSRQFGGVFKIKKRIDISSSGSSTYQDPRSFPDTIPALTDMKLTVENVTANNTGIFGSFDIELVDESQFSDAYLASIGQPGY